MRAVAWGDMRWGAVVGAMWETRGASRMGVVGATLCRWRGRIFGFGVAGFDAACAAPTGAAAGFVSDCRSGASRERDTAATTKPPQWLCFRGRDLRRSYREIRNSPETL